MNSQRCPKCNSRRIHFDSRGNLTCDKCGYEHSNDKKATISVFEEAKWI